MSVKLSYDICRKKVEKLTKELKGVNWLLEKTNYNSVITYNLYCNNKLKTSGTLKEVDNYIEGLYTGYGIESVDNKTQDKPITATLDFTVKKEPVNKEIAKQFNFYGVQKYHCVIQYLPYPNDDFYMKVTIDNYSLDKSKKSTVLTIPKMWFNVHELYYHSTLEGKAKDILNNIDEYLFQSGTQALEIGNTEKAWSYLTTLAELQKVYHNYVIKWLSEKYGNKLESVYTKNMEITNIKATNLEQISYNN